jgi:uncharacterized SAM-binding protein YcdF (DUF218 family)
MIKLCIIFFGLGVIAFFLDFNASLKKRLLISFLCFTIPLIISFIVIMYSGDKPAKDSYEYKGTENKIE